MVPGLSEKKSMVVTLTEGARVEGLQGVMGELENFFFL